MSDIKIIYNSGVGCIVDVLDDRDAPGNREEGVRGWETTTASGIQRGR